MDNSSSQRDSKRSKVESNEVMESRIVTHVKKLGLDYNEAVKWLRVIEGVVTENGISKAFLLYFCKHFLKSKVLAPPKEPFDLDDFVTKLLADVYPRISFRAFRGRSSTEKAFEIEYEDDGGEEAFWKHLEDQRKKYWEQLEEQRNKNSKARSKSYPFFCIMQSSGYGESRLVDILRRQLVLLDTLRHQLNDMASIEERPSKIVYLSFASGEAYPGKNVSMSTRLKNDGTSDDVEDAFLRLFAQSRIIEHQERYDMSYVKGSSISRDRPKSAPGLSVLFVVDEASELRNMSTKDRRDFLLCLCRATAKHVATYSQDFFVLLSAFSSASQSMQVAAMEPFLLHHAIGVRNDFKKILDLSVDDWLFAMGRPLWYAHINATSSFMLELAQCRLMQRRYPKKMSSHQVLALLACRVCLTITPFSRMAPSLVCNHMATVVRASASMDEVVVEYPSEPILAVASRWYWDEGFLLNSFSRMKEYYASGDVEKGHQGDMIVRLLTLVAIDRCQYNAYVNEAGLKRFLTQFDRDEAKLSTVLERSIQNVETSEQEKRVLGSLDTMTRSEESLLLFATFQSRYLDEGRVCFTHFVKLSREECPLITPDLLRYAYRRTSAIVVDAESRGIDWIIPVRVGMEDKFVGLAGQDKNRLDEVLESESDYSSEATDQPATTDYFLTREERESFREAGFPLDWPAILFSTGAEEQPGAALAQHATRIRIWHPTGNKPIVQEFSFPCLVLTGLQYSKLMDGDADSKLQELGDFVLDPPDAYRDAVPLTYGA